MTMSISSTVTPAAFSACIQLLSLLRCQVGRCGNDLSLPDAGIHQDRVVRCLDDIGLEAQHRHAGRIERRRLHHDRFS
jgi:hypothetical protein